MHLSSISRHPGSEEIHGERPIELGLRSILPFRRRSRLKKSFGTL